MVGHWRIIPLKESIPFHSQLAPLSQESKYWALEIGCSPADGAASAGRVQPWDALAILGQAKLLCSDKNQQRGDGVEEDLAEPIWAKVREGQRR